VSDTVVAAVLGAVGSLATALVTYLIAVRRPSAKIRNGAGDALWAEGTAIRKELRDRLELVEGRTKDQEGEIETLRKEREDLRQQVRSLAWRLKTYED
jgi:hypothetical protein